MNYYKDDKDGYYICDVNNANFNWIEITEQEYNQANIILETQEQIISRLESALDKYIDEQAKSYRYESIRTMVTYATSGHPVFGPEGRAAVKFRDACYAKAFEILDDVAASTREVPTEAELIAEMPLFSEFLTYE